MPMRSRSRSLSSVNDARSRTSPARSGASFWTGPLVTATVPGRLAPVHTGKEQPDFQPVLYTLDLLVPVINIHQRDAWTAHGLAAWLVLAFTLTGWLLTTAFVLSVTGFLKRD